MENLNDLKKQLRNLNAKRRRCELLDDAIKLGEQIKEVKKMIECEKIKETPILNFDELIRAIRHEIMHLTIDRFDHWGSPKNVAKEIQIFKSAEMLGIVDNDFFEERCNFDNIELLEAVGMEAINKKAHLQIVSLKQLAKNNNLKK